MFHVLSYQIYDIHRVLKISDLLLIILLQF